MRLGSGVQIKLLQALAIGIPSITTNLSFQGLFSEAKDAIVIAEKPDEFVTAILGLLNDEDYYKTLIVKGKLFVSNNYSIEKVEKKLLDIINSFQSI